MANKQKTVGFYVAVVMGKAKSLTQCLYLKRGKTMLKLKLTVEGESPTVDTLCLAFAKNDGWHLGCWIFWEHKLWLEVEHGEIPIEDISAWVELPENLEGITKDD